MQNPAINAGLLTIPSSFNLILINLNFYTNFIFDLKISFIYIFIFLMHSKSLLKRIILC